MYARTEFLYAVLLAASFIEGSQTTLQVRATPLVNVSFFPLVAPCSVWFLFICFSKWLCFPSTLFPNPPAVHQLYFFLVIQRTWWPDSSLFIRVLHGPPRNLVRSAPPILTSRFPRNSHRELRSINVWNPVNVAQGWFTLLATIPAIRPTKLLHHYFSFAPICLIAIISATLTHIPTIHHHHPYLQLYLFPLPIYHPHPRQRYPPLLASL